MRDASHTIRQEILGVALFIGAIWAVFLLSRAFPNLNQHGVIPRTLRGILGIPAMPFLHQNLTHIVRNTLPLAVLLVLLAGSHARSWQVVLNVALLGGLLLWIFGRPASHIGASGLISGLIAFLIVSGFREGRLIPLVVALSVGFFYGGSFLAGIVPRLGSTVSWDGHLTGAIAGALVAFALTRGSDQPTEPPASPLGPGVITRLEDL